MLQSTAFLGEIFISIIIISIANSSRPGGLVGIHTQS